MAGGQRLEETVARLLRAGVTISAALALAGGIWYLAQEGNRIRPYTRFVARVRGPAALLHLPGSQALILAGLLALIATPVACVVLCLVAFAMQRDRVYVICTLIVLLVLLYSIGTALL